MVEPLATAPGRLPAPLGGATAAADGPLLHLQATAAGATVLAAEPTTEPATEPTSV